MSEEVNRKGEKNAVPEKRGRSREVLEGKRKSLDSYFMALATKGRKYGSNEIQKKKGSSPVYPPKSPEDGKGRKREGLVVAKRREGAEVN